MKDLFSPPGLVWEPVSPALARMRRTVLVSLGAVASAGVVCAGLVMPLWLVVAAELVLLVLLGAGWVLIGRNARWWGYAERDDSLYIRHGALFRALVLVPYARLQYVDVQAGPLEQAYGVASVHFHTASPGTSARIPGLPAGEAARLRDRLTELGQSQGPGL